MSSRKPLEDERTNPSRIKTAMAAISPGSRITHYDALIRGAQAAYDQYLKASEELDRLEELVNQI